MCTTLFKNARLILPTGIFLGELLVRDDKIEAVSIDAGPHRFFFRFNACLSIALSGTSPHIVFNIQASTLAIFSIYVRPK